MPLPADHHVKAGWYIVDATGKRVWCCNCPSSPPTQTLRYVAANRQLFSLPAPAAAAAAQGSAT